MAGASHTAIPEFNRMGFAFFCTSYTLHPCFLPWAFFLSLLSLLSATGLLSPAPGHKIPSYWNAVWKGLGNSPLWIPAVQKIKENISLQFTASSYMISQCPSPLASFLFCLLSVPKFLAPFLQGLHTKARKMPPVLSSSCKCYSSLQELTLSSIYFFFLLVTLSLSLLGEMRDRMAGDRGLLFLPQLVATN